MKLKAHPDYLTMHCANIIDNVIHLHCKIEVYVKDSEPNILYPNYFKEENNNYSFLWIFPREKKAFAKFEFGKYLGKLEEFVHEGDISKGIGMFEFKFNIDSYPDLLKDLKKLGDYKFLKKTELLLVSKTC